MSPTLPAGSALKVQEVRIANLAKARRRHQDRLKTEDNQRSRFVLRRSIEIEATGILPGDAWAAACGEWDSTHDRRAA